jgi:hypothetical protein
LPDLRATLRSALDQAMEENPARFDARSLRQAYFEEPTIRPN